MTNNITRVALAFAGLGLLATSALGQWGGKPGPTPVTQDALATPNIAGWANAYRAWNHPRILVLSGWSTSAHAADSPADLLFNTDESGMSHQLKAAFEMVVNAPEADVFLVDANQANAAAIRLRAALEANSERDAVALLARELDAELVVVLRLLDYNEAGDAPGRVIAQAIDAASARTLWTLPFQWKGDGSARNIRVYGEQLAARFIDEYAVRSLRAQRYTVRLLGASDDPGVVRAVRDHLRQIPGVTGIVERYAAAAPSGTGSPGGAMTLEVQFAGGFLDLQAGIADRLYDFDAGGARIIDAAGTTITLDVIPGDGHPHASPMGNGVGVKGDADGLIDVIIEGLASADQLEEFTRAVRTRGELGSPISIADLVGFTGGVDGAPGSARLVLAHDAPFERVLTELRSIEGELAYAIEIEHLDRQSIVLRARTR